MSNIKIEQQEKIINLSDKNIIVSASAGSGKTSTMIRKIYNYIKNKNINIDEMLVLTYTEAAAEEMKMKIENCLCNEFDSSADDESKINLQKQLNLLPNADISTIHHFCLKMLNIYFYELNIQPNIKILDEEKVNTLKLEIINDTIKKFKSSNKEDYKLLLKYFTTQRNDDDVIKILVKIDSFLQGQLSEDKWLDEKIDYLYNKNISDKLLNDRIIGFRDDSIILLNTFKKYCNSINDEYFVSLVQKCFEKIYLIKDYSNFEENFISFLKIKNLPIVSKNCEDEMLKEKYNDIKSEIGKNREVLKKLLKFGDEEDIQKFDENFVKIVKTLKVLFKNYKKSYQSNKKTLNVMDFSDLERNLIKMLNIDKVCNIIKNKYKYIFIDEFQDANEIQNYIINKLRSTSNLFLVGDVKQSIYGFRNSNPEIFVNKLTEFKANKDSDYLNLNCNFRSSDDILNFTNFVFSKLMKSNNPELDYYNNSMLKGFVKYEDIKPGVEINIIDKVKNKKEINEVSKFYDIKNHRNEEVDDFLEQEVDLVISKIFEFKNQKIYDSKMKELRSVNYKDIAILVRSTTQINRLVNKCINLGIPIKAKLKNNIFDSNEIIELITLLKFIENQDDDILLASVLTSNFVGLSYDDLLTVKDKFPNLKFNRRIYSYIDNINDNISNKIKLFLEEVDFIKDKTMLSGIYDTLLYLIDKYNYLEYLSTFENALIKLNNLNSFLNFVKLNNLELHSFNILIGSMCNGISSNPSVESDDCINITTIHSSKGLEYPIVILFNTSEAINKSNGFGPKITLTNKYGLSYKNNYNKNGNKFNTKTDIINKLYLKEKNIIEVMRLYYVALTRAKNYLCITGYLDMAKIKEAQFKFQMYKKSSFLEVLISILGSSNIERLKENKLFVQKYEKSNFVYKIIGDERKINSVEKIKNYKSQNNDTLKDIQNTIIQFDCEDNKIAFKNSVSNLAFDDNYCSCKNFMPSKLKISDDGVDKKPNEVGELYHLIFEKLDFASINNIQDIENELMKYCDCNLITKEESDLIDRNLILNFIIKIKPYLKNKKIIKEKEFIMKINHNEIIENGLDEKVIVQGKIDLILLGENNILIDYKYTKNYNEEKIKQKYKKQLSIYKTAFERAFDKKIDACYIYSILENKLIKI